MAVAVDNIVAYRDALVMARVDLAAAKAKLDEARLAYVRECREALLLCQAINQLEGLLDEPITDFGAIRMECRKHSKEIYAQMGREARAARVAARDK